MAQTTGTTGTTTKTDDAAMTTADPGAPLKTETSPDLLDKDGGKKQLPGAQALTDVFNWLLDGAGLISAAMGSQENEAVKQMLTEWLEITDKESAELATKFTEIYPDDPPLEGMTLKAEGDKKPEEVKDAPEDDLDPLEKDDRFKKLRPLLIKRWQDRRAALIEGETKKLEAVQTKRMTKAAQSTIGDAAEHLDDLGREETLKGGMRNLCKYHGGELKKLMAGADTEPDQDDEIERKRLNTDTEVEKRVKTLAEEMAKSLVAKAQSDVAEVIKKCNETLATVVKSAVKTKQEIAKAKQGR